MEKGRRNSACRERFLLKFFEFIQPRQQTEQIIVRPDLCGRKIPDDEQIKLVALTLAKRAIKLHWELSRTPKLFYQFVH